MGQHCVEQRIDPNEDFKSPASRASPAKKMRDVARYAPLPLGPIEKIRLSCGLEEDVE